MTRTATTAIKAGIPAVAIIGSSFRDTVKRIAAFEGVPGLPTAVYPGAIQGHTPEELRRNVEGMIDDIVRGLTTSGPLSRKQSAAQPGEAAAFEGTLTEIHAHFLAQRWSDGHPFIPPTPARVRAFLRHTDLPAHDPIVRLPVSYAAATPWNVAANAVMAGCAPEHLPLLIAVVEALGDPQFDITGFGSTGGYFPFVVVNGPIARALDIRSDLPGIAHPVNAVLGRAVGLILRNVAGFIPGDTAMGTFGYIQPFVFAEDDEVCTEIGWQPFHVRRGYPPSASTVTLGGTGNWGHQSTPTGADADRLVEYGVREVARRVIAERSVYRRDASGMLAMVITPSVSRVLAGGGYTPESLAQYWFEHATITRDEYDFRSRYGQSATPAPTIASLLAKGAIDPKWFDRGPDEAVPMFQTPKSLHVFVAGDRGRNKYTSLWGPYFSPTTKRVRRPREQAHGDRAGHDNERDGGAA